MNSGPTPDPAAVRAAGATLGDRYDPFGTHLADPYAFYRQARQERPVFFAPAINAWVLTRHADIRFALAHPEVFSSVNALRPLTALHPATSGILAGGYPRMPEPTTADGAAHRRLRAPIAKALSPARVDALEPFIRKRAAALLDAFAADGHAELIAQYARPLPVQVICHLLGIRPEHVEQITRGSFDSVRVVASRRPESEQVKAAGGLVALQRLCGQYARRRRRRPGDDLISALVATLAPGDDPLTAEQEAEIAQVVHGIVIAGHVTTSAVIGSAVWHLLSVRDRWELLCRRVDLIPNAVEELLRFDPPVQGFLRLTTQPVTVSGVELPAGAEVFLAYGAANHDPDQFPNPDRPDISRPLPSRHLAFAAGVHHCVGATLARTQLAVTLELLSRKFPSLHLTDEVVLIEPTMTTRGPSPFASPGDKPAVRRVVRPLPARSTTPSPPGRAGSPSQGAPAQRQGPTQPASERPATPQHRSRSTPKEAPDTLPVGSTRAELLGPATETRPQKQVKADGQQPGTSSHRHLRRSGQRDPRVQASRRRLDPDAGLVRLRPAAPP